MSKRETMLAVQVERAAVIAYVRGWAAQLRREAPRDAAAAAVYADVQDADAIERLVRAEHERMAVLLETICGRVENGAHLHRPPPTHGGVGR